MMLHKLQSDLMTWEGHSSLQGNLWKWRFAFKMVTVGYETIEEAGLGKERKGAVKSFCESMIRRPQGWRSSAE